MGEFTFNGPVDATSIGNNNTIDASGTRRRPRPAPEPIPPRADDGEEYDLAFSFASSDREYVEETKIACEELGLRVRYDKDLVNEMWGENFLTAQRRVYRTHARFVVAFISAEYFRRPVATDEFLAAMWTDVKQGGGYILPVLIGEVDVPDDMLHPHVGHLRAEDYEPDELAHEMLRKVRRATQRQS